MLWNVLICATVLMLLSQTYAKKQHTEISNCKRGLFDAVRDFDNVLEPEVEKKLYSSKFTRDSKLDNGFAKREKSSLDKNLSPHKITSKQRPSEKYARLYQSARMFRYKTSPNVKFKKRSIESGNVLQPNIPILSVRSFDNDQSGQLYMETQRGMNSDVKNLYVTKDIENIANRRLADGEKSEKSQLDYQFSETPNDEKMKVEKDFLTNSGNPEWASRTERILLNYDNLNKPDDFAHVSNNNVRNVKEKVVQTNDAAPVAGHNGKEAIIKKCCNQTINRFYPNPIENNKLSLLTNLYQTPSLALVQTNDAAPVADQNGKEAIIKKCCNQTINRFYPNPIENNKLSLLTNLRQTPSLATPSKNRIVNRNGTHSLSLELQMKVIPNQATISTTSDSVIEEDASLKIVEYHRRKVSRHKARTKIANAQAQMQYSKDVNGIEAYKTNYFPQFDKVNLVTQSAYTLKNKLNFHDQKNPDTYTGGAQVLYNNPNVIHDNNNGQYLQILQLGKMLPQGAKISQDSQLLSNVNIDQVQTNTNIPQVYGNLKLNGKRSDEKGFRQQRFVALPEGKKKSAPSIKNVPLLRREIVKSHRTNYMALHEHNPKSYRVPRNPETFENSLQKSQECILKPLPHERHNRRLHRSFHASRHRNEKPYLRATKYGNPKYPKKTKVKRSVDSSKNLFKLSNMYMKQAYKLLDELELMEKHSKIRSLDLPSLQTNNRLDFIGDPEGHSLGLRDSGATTISKCAPRDVGIHVQLNPELLQKIDAIKASIQNAMHPISIVKLNTPGVNYHISPEILERINELRANVAASMEKSIPSAKNNLIQYSTAYPATTVRVQDALKATPASSLRSAGTTQSTDNLKRPGSVQVFIVNPKALSNKLNQKKSNVGNENYDYYEDYSDDLVTKLKRARRKLPDASRNTLGLLKRQVCALKKLDLQTLKKIREHMNAIQTLINARSITFVASYQTSNSTSTAQTLPYNPNTIKINSTTVQDTVFNDVYTSSEVLSGLTLPVLLQLKDNITTTTYLDLEIASPVYTTTTTPNLSTTLNKSSLISSLKSTAKTNKINRKKATKINVDRDVKFEKTLLQTMLEVYQYLMLYRAAADTDNDGVTSTEQFTNHNHKCPTFLRKYSEIIRDVQNNLKRVASNNSSPNENDQSNISETSANVCNDTETTENYSADYYALLHLLRNTTLPVCDLEETEPKNLATPECTSSMTTTQSPMPNSTVPFNTTTQTFITTATTPVRKLQKYSLLLQALLNSKRDNQDSSSD